MGFSVRLIDLELHTVPGARLSAEIKAGDEVTAAVEKAPGVKCPRCWNYSEKADAEGLCPRCQAVMFKRVETTR